MILMVNCSYKGNAGNTAYFLKLLEKELEQCSEKKCRIVSLRAALKDDLKTFGKELQKAEALVIGAPLYVDGLPAQAVKLLEVLLERYKGAFPGLPVYVVSNLGFYESRQIRHLLDMVRNWCRRMGCMYGGGLAIGAGPMISTLKSMPLKSGLNKDIGKGLETLAVSVAERKSMENYYCKTAIPRIIYIKAAHGMFRRTLKVNGALTKK